MKLHNTKIKIKMCQHTKRQNQNASLSPRNLYRNRMFYLGGYRFLENFKLNVKCGLCHLLTWVTLSYLIPGVYVNLEC